MSDFKERLSSAMKQNGMTRYALSKATGLSASTITNWLNGATTPDSTKLEVVGLHLGCTPEWLLTGEGLMFSPKKVPVCETEQEVATQLRLNIADSIFRHKITIKEISNRFNVEESVIKKLVYDFKSDFDIPFLEDILEYTILSERDTRPRIPLTAAAGSLSYEERGVTLKECEQTPIVNQFPSYDFTMFIKGDSMSPKYESGDEIACRWVNEKRFIQWGKVHVLDTTQGIIVKKVYEDGDKIRCVSVNPDYPPFSVPKDDIHSMSLVVGVLSIIEM